MAEIEKLIHVPGQMTLTLRDVLHRIESFLGHMPSLKFVLIVCRQGEAGKVACTRNVSLDMARQMLRTAESGIAEGRIAKIDV